MLKLRRLKEDPDEENVSFKVGPYTITQKGLNFDVEGHVDTDFDIKLSIDPDTNASAISIGKDTTNLSTSEAETLISELSKVIKYAETIDDDIFEIL